MNDILLIDGLKARDKGVYDFIFNYYYSSLCTFSLQFINDSDAVEDIVQDFFVDLWNKSSGLQISGQNSLRRYLFASIKNKCLDVLKHNSVKSKHRKYVLAVTEQVNYNTEYYMAESELRNSYHSCLAKLPARCKEIFEYSRDQGLSNQEIADKLGLSKRTVELQISNALKILKKELAEFLPIMLLPFL